jgi:hypothetical protein
VASGGLFFAFGTMTFLLAMGYKVGIATKMGPGYFPAALGIVLMALGVGGVASGLLSTAPAHLPKLPISPVLGILIGIALFAQIIDRFGLVEAVFALVVSSCIGSLRSRPVEVLLIAVVLSAMSAGLFIYGLKLPFKLI